jgi:hypothetical protein
MAYEKSGRMREALDQYEKAMHMDPFYRAAAEAVSRLSKTVQTKPAPVQTTGPTPPPAPHLMTGEDGLPIADPMAPPPDQQAAPHAPQPLSSNDEPYVPTYSGHQPGPQTAADLKPVGIPAAPPPPAATPGRLPDLRSLEMRTRENEEKARQAQREMTKAGLIYGMILGPIGLMGALGLSRVFLPVTSGFFLFVLGAGVVLGAIVGLWTGFTCGDETTGAKTGALLGLLGLGIPALIGGGGTLGMTGVVLQAVLGLVLGGAAGYFIGMMVEHSIGQ